jgi:hypothetical protein
MTLAGRSKFAGNIITKVYVSILVIGTVGGVIIAALSTAEYYIKEPV